MCNRYIHVFTIFTTRMRIHPGAREIWCGFDNGICDFLQDLEDDSDWELGSGHTSDPQTGPSGDHTTQSGKLTVESYLRRVI